MSAITEARDAVRALGHSGNRILVGPWLGEVGFEVLYWIPFLRWLIRASGVSPEQLLFVSRGGVESWYQEFGGRYADLFDHVTPDQYIAGNEQRVAEQTDRGQSLGFRRGQRIGKQFAVSAFDEAIREAVQPAGEPRLELLHPSLMFFIFRNFWRGVSGQDPYRECMRVARMKALPIAGLPDRYIAMKWYVSNAFQDRPKTRRGIRQIVEALAQDQDIVLLHTGTRYDDHGEFDLEDHPRIHRIELQPRTNLAIQSAIISGASSYVGTYGGFAYLAPFLGVPARTVYTDTSFRIGHLDLIRTVSIVNLKASFEASSLDQVLVKPARSLHAA